MDSLVARPHITAAEGIAHAQLLMIRIETFLQPSTTDPVLEIAGSLIQEAQVSISRALSVLSPQVIEQKPNSIIRISATKRKMLDGSGVTTDSNKRRPARNQDLHGQCCYNTADCIAPSNDAMISSTPYKVEEMMSEATLSIVAEMDPSYVDKLMMMRRHLLDDD